MTGRTVLMGERIVLVKTMGMKPCPHGHSVDIVLLAWHAPDILFTSSRQTPRFSLPWLHEGDPREPRSCRMPNLAFLRSFRHCGASTWAGIAHRRSNSGPPQGTVVRTGLRGIAIHLSQGIGHLQTGRWWADKQGRAQDVSSFHPWQGSGIGFH